MTISISLEKIHLSRDQFSHENLHFSQHYEITLKLFLFFVDYIQNCAYFVNYHAINVVAKQLMYHVYIRFHFVKCSYGKSQIYFSLKYIYIYDGVRLFMVSVCHFHSQTTVASNYLWTVISYALENYIAFRYRCNRKPIKKFQLCMVFKAFLAELFYKNAMTYEWEC